MITRHTLPTYVVVVLRQLAHLRDLLQLIVYSMRLLPYEAQGVVALSNRGLPVAERLVSLRV